MLANFMKTKMYNSNLFDYLKQCLTSLGSQLEFMSKKHSFFWLENNDVFSFVLLLLLFFI